MRITHAELPFLMILCALLAVSAKATEAVWDGNGHAYEAVYAPGMSWDNAQAECVARGGYLATATSAEENTFIESLFEDNPSFWYVDSYDNALGPWLGGRQAPGAEEPDGGWYWVTGEPWSYTDWSTNQPDNAFGGQELLRYVRWDNTPPTGWDDCEVNNPSSHRRGYIFEKDAPPAVVFREGAYPSWSVGQVPGWDHVGMLFDEQVYEAHPGYDPGNYWDPLLHIWIPINASCGVFAQHSPGSFQHNSMSQSSGSTNARAALERDDAAGMAAFVQSVIGGDFIDFDSCFDDPGIGCVNCFTCLRDRGQPQQQKGLQSSWRFCQPPDEGIAYTCVGLIERAAEEAGINGGEGFIPNARELLYLVGFGDLPLLSPQLLAWHMELTPGGLREGDEWLAGVLYNPVDFIVTDPEGRRLGYTAAEGTLLEIPGAYYSGNGNSEMFFVTAASTGTYVLELTGLGEEIEVGFGGSVSGQYYTGFLDEGEIESLGVELPVSVVEDSDRGRQVDAFFAEPNPLFERTVVRYHIENASQVCLEVYDPAGRVVAELVNEAQSAGMHAASWNGRDVDGERMPAGVYFARMQTEDRDQTLKLLVLR